MRMSRRNAIALIAALPLAAVASRPTNGAARTSADPFDEPYESGRLVGLGLSFDGSASQARRDEFRRQYFRLVPIWNRTPAGREKECLFREFYRSAVLSNTLRYTRIPELDRELGLS